MMASIGSFPFLVETNAESTVFLLHTRNLKFPQKFGTWNSSSIEHSGARGLGRGRLNYRCSRGLFCLFGNSRIRAVGKNFGTNQDQDESEEVLQATIEKSKKVLALQKELLQQIADRKKMVSSIKSESIPESEGNGISYQNESLSSDSNPEKVSASRGSKSEGDSISYQNSDKSLSSDKSQSRGSNVENQNDRIVLGNYVLSRQKENLDGSSVGSDRSFDKDEEEHDEFSPVEMVSSKLDEQLKNKRYDTVRRETLPNEIANGFQIPELNVENREGVTESSSKEVANKADDVEREVEKPPPLAGANAMNVILVAAECAPWSKTGGLGDVAGSLPKALARRGHRVMVVVPRYGDYREAQETGVRKRYKVDGQDMEVTYLHTYIDGVDFVFIDSPIFRHLGNNVYDGKRVDILKRMVLFCKAAVEVPWHVPCGGICYGDGNLAFIANDWHTALLPVYLKAYYRDHGLMKYTRSILVIHNIAHQGRGPLDEYNIVDLPEQYKDLFRLYDPVGGEHLNIFAAGLKMADRIVTVSHGYAWELKTVEGGWGLHGIINENDWKFRGIVNGIDTKDWNPQFDVHLKSDGYINYTLETLHTGKPQCKAALQKELGLPVREDVPLIGFIGRLDGQKGVDLIAEAIPWMMGQDVQLVMLGTGRPDLEQMLQEVESQHRDKVRGWVGFSVKTAHRITAGSDILLMPSRFEPCGLNQLYAMNYGTVPVVHAVGGLRDTVTPFNPFEESGLGWTFDSAEANKLIHALGNCLLTYRQYKKSWEGLQQRGMTQNLSWDNAAQYYEEVLVAAKYQW